MKKQKSLKTPDHPALLHDLPERLAELETELRRHTARKAEDRPLKSVSGVSEVVFGRQKAVQFSTGEKTYAAGHEDVTHAGSNHSRGVRHIRFYVAGKVVLDIEGDFEDQQLGTNFRFKNVDLYTPGAWETDFIKLTNILRLHTAKRRMAFNQKRAAENARARR